MSDLISRQEAIDDLLRLGPYLGSSWWSEVTG